MTALDDSTVPVSQLLEHDGQSQRLAVVFAALSHPTRLRLLSWLALRGETRRSVLNHMFGDLSDHLKRLETVGFVIARRPPTGGAQVVTYRLADGALDHLASLISPRD
ncbi:ArsR/SmtB family transcription factor [Luteipulveratus mongoliensis]|uniref:ArsR/SmtB family transcription factor n=1 Tax=Luteipulveratus mongoliensis TaxID=571913 RepID=UPI00146FFB48|nr:helix-turn-helix domain-containing protein [Luteipulveratus mongoliensis]